MRLETDEEEGCHKRKTEDKADDVEMVDNVRAVAEERIDGEEDKHKQHCKQGGDGKGYKEGTHHAVEALRIASIAPYTPCQQVKGWQQGVEVADLDTGCPCVGQDCGKDVER